MKSDLIYPDLSYKIVGVLFDVYNEVGYGYQEKYYQKAIAKAFIDSGIKYQEQVYQPLKFRDSKIGSYFLDFLIEGKIVLEIKKGNYFSRKNIEQLYAYLKATDLKLGILANFTSDGVKIKRIVNIRDY
ncbi:GxxExxY protein [Patescibacteria group bacterium]|nr:GxxExxY protein [Patescibacteria group bacterium]